MSICVGSMVKKAAFYVGSTPLQTQFADRIISAALEVGLVLELDRRAMGRPVWTVLWPDGSIGTEYDRDLDLVQEGRV